MHGIIVERFGGDTGFGQRGQIAFGIAAAAVDAKCHRRVRLQGGEDVVPMLGIMAVQIIHPPFGQIVFGGVVFLTGSGKLFALAQKAAQNGVGKRAVLAFADFGASTLDFSLKFWVRDYDVAVSTASDIRLEIEREFREQRIEIAFPQLDINIKELPPRTKAPLPSAEPRVSKRRAPRRPRRVLPAAAKAVKPGDKKTATPEDGDDDENNN